MANGVINGTINIDWFGNRQAYAQSDIKIITVGLNPSGIEFGVDKKNKTPNVNLRFGHIPANQIPTHPSTGTFPNAWNDYFNFNPYKWFSQGFEHILRGLKASYGGKLLQNDEMVSRTAIHTDLCTPWATDPTWGNLQMPDKQALTSNFTFPEWTKLVEELNPDIIIFSVPYAYWSQLKNLKNIKKWKNLKFDFGKKRPCWYYKGYYQLHNKKALAILGITTQRGPFGDLNNNEKIILGTMI